MEPCATHDPDRCRCLSPTANVQLFENVVDMVFDGRGTDPQAPCNLLVRMALVHQLDDLEFSACESRDARIGPMRICKRGQPPEEGACDLRRAKHFAT